MTATKTATKKVKSEEPKDPLAAIPPASIAEVKELVKTRLEPATKELAKVIAEHDAEVAAKAIEGTLITTEELRAEDPFGKNIQFVDPYDLPALEGSKSFPVNGDGKVIVHGKQLTPIKTGIKQVNGNLTVEGYPQGNVPYYLCETPPWLVQKTEEKQDPLEFSLFEVPVGKRTVYFYVDKTSSVTVGNNYQVDPIMFRLVGDGVAVLVNASSKNDIFIGQSTLVNVQSEDNVLNSSTLENRKKDRGLNSWGTDPHFGLTKFFNAQFRQSVITNSSLPPGNYLNVIISDTTIISSGSVSLYRSDLTNCYVTGGNLDLDKVQFFKTQIRSPGEVKISSTNFTEEHITGDSIYLLDKFSYLAIDVPYGKVHLTRSSGTEFVLAFDYCHGKPKPLDSSEEEIRKAAYACLIASRYGDNPGKSLECIIDYVTEAVISRLKVINKLQEARNLIQDVAPSYDRDYRSRDPYAS